MLNKKLASIVAGCLIGTASLFAQKINGVSVPADLDVKMFADKDKAPCPACLTAGPDGSVFVGVDRNGSLGKKPNNGEIVKLIDTDNDGSADKAIKFADVQNPRGLAWFNDKLYVLHPPHMSVYTDANGDGVADGEPERLITNISVPKHNQSRGADHTTNGIQMGIDGWIYIAIGDFGFSEAKAKDGTVLTMLGGGIVRIRPDGTGMETYVHGLRNIYDVAIDPYMNIFTRGNTNDGGGWNIRFIHSVQSSQYGYPILFKRYTDEVLPALIDAGGGSGTGAMFFQEPGWPEKYNNNPFMCDWGRSHMYIHRVKPDGASFTQEIEDFIKVQKITDVAADGSGRLYIGSWGNNGFSGGKDGWVVQVTPKGWKYTPFPNLEKMSAADLAANLNSESKTMRFYAQQEFLRRKAKGDVSGAAGVLAVAKNSSSKLYGRVAAIFTYKQMLDEKSTSELVKLAEDSAVREWALRAIADIKAQNSGLSAAIFSKYLKDSNPRVQVAAAVALGRINKPEAADAILANMTMGDHTPFMKEAPQKMTKVKPLFSSNVIKQGQSVDIDVDITGSKELVLVVQDGGDGTGNDHGSWFDPVVVDKGGNKTSVLKMKWTQAKAGWGKVRKNKSCNGSDLKRQDGKPHKEGIGSHSVSVIAYNLPPNAARFQAVGALSSTAKGGSVKFEVYSAVPSGLGKALIPEGPHAKPNSAKIPSHVAVKSLVDLNAIDACLKASTGSNHEMALRALRYIHDDKVVDGLIANLGKTSDEMVKKKILMTLIRLYNREPFYDGSWWWGTRPDTRGPYYKQETWSGSAKIAAAVKPYLSNPEFKEFVENQMIRDRVEFNAGQKDEKTTVAKVDVDLSKIASKKGQVGKMAIEDLLVAIKKVKGDPKQGNKLFTQQGCFACHSLNAGDPLKGPHLGQIGAILDREGLAMAILKPNDRISQGFATFNITLKDGMQYTGFISKETADQIELRNIAGQIFTIPTSKIKERKESHVSMMPAGLVNALSIEEFASMLTFLQNKKK